MQKSKTIGVKNIFIKRKLHKNSMISQGLIKVRKKWMVIPTNVGSYPFFTLKGKELCSLTKNLPICNTPFFFSSEINDNQIESGFSKEYEFST